MKWTIGFLGCFVGCFGHLVAGPAIAQVEIGEAKIVISPRGTESCQVLRGRFRAFEKRVDLMQGHMKGRTLPLTGCEVWSMPKGELEAFKDGSARSGVVVTEIGSDWNRAFWLASPGVRLSRQQRDIVEAAKAAKATKGVRIMEGPIPAVLEYMLIGEADDPASTKVANIIIALSNKTVRTIVRSSVDIRADLVVWRGTVERTGGTVTLMWWPSGKLSGTIQDDGRLYSIRHLGDRFYAVIEMSPEQMPDEHAPTPKRLRAIDPNRRDDPPVIQGDASVLRGTVAGHQLGVAPRAGGLERQPGSGATGSKVVASKEIVIDVIVAYTKKAASYYADVQRELVALSIEEANHSFRMSNLGHIRLNLVHAYQTDYTEQGEHFDHLYRMVDRGDGYMEEIHDLRDKHHADIAVLIVDDGKGCGLATRVYADADDAFAVVHHVCSAATFSLAHEVGHLIGARHELAVDQSMLPFPYGHGYVNGTKWRDIMSHKASCGGCPRLPVWSSPNVRVRGEPAGTSETDNARVISEQAARVAAFRPSIDMRD